MFFPSYEVIFFILNSVCKHSLLLYLLNMLLICDYLFFLALHYSKLLQDCIRFWRSVLDVNECIPRTFDGFEAFVEK